MVRYLKRAFFSSLLAVMPVFADTPAKEGPWSFEDNTTYHVYDDIDLVSTIKFEYGRQRIVIKSIYPQLASDTERESVIDFNALARRIVRDEIIQFRREVKNQAAQQKKIKNKITNNFYIDYSSSYIPSRHNHIISIRFTTQAFIAGIHRPKLNHRVINYNLDKNQPIDLAKLFRPGTPYLERLSDYTRRALSRHLENQQKIIQGTAPLAENFSLWNMTTDGLLITFDDNAVAPYDHGMQSVLVPYSALLDIISPDAPIAYCVEHRSRCLRSKLLTGGFIDEAAAKTANSNVLIASK